jgi:hypothetical protein
MIGSLLIRMVLGGYEDELRLMELAQRLQQG